MPSGLTYVAWGFIRIRFLSHFQLHLDSGGQLHKCFHLLIDLLWLVHSYTFKATFTPSFYFVWVKHGMSCSWPPSFSCQTWQTYHTCFCLRIGILCPYVAAAWRTSGIIPWVLFSPPWSAWGHETHTFCHRSADFSDGLHNFSCAFQRGPSRDWFENTASPPLRSLPWLTRLASVLVVVLEGVPTLYTCSVISIRSHISHVSLQVFPLKSHNCRYDFFPIR